MSSMPLEVEISRNADYSLLKIAAKFEPASHDLINGTCGNIKWDIEGRPTLSSNDEYEKTLAYLVSSPFLLARLCALFTGLQLDVGGQEYYKVTWQTVLKHKDTGHVVTFYDYKGGSSFGSDVYGEKAPKAFVKDVRSLIDALKNDRFPHPYDGCVVGEIA